jgi:hypothetical protein
MQVKAVAEMQYSITPLLHHIITPKGRRGEGLIEMGAPARGITAPLSKS